jgi:hypothetical protein
LLLIGSRLSTQLSEEPLRPFYAALSYQMQQDLEAVAMDLVTGLQKRTGGKE